MSHLIKVTNKTATPASFSTYWSSGTPAILNHTGGVLDASGAALRVAHFEDKTRTINYPFFHAEANPKEPILKMYWAGERDGFNTMEGDCWETINSERQTSTGTQQLPDINWPVATELVRRPRVVRFIIAIAMHGEHANNSFESGFTWNNQQTYPAINRRVRFNTWRSAGQTVRDNIEPTDLYWRIYAAPAESIIDFQDNIDFGGGSAIGFTGFMRYVRTITPRHYEWHTQSGSLYLPRFHFDYIGADVLNVVIVSDIGIGSNPYRQKPASYSSITDYAGPHTLQNGFETTYHWRPPWSATDRNPNQRWLYERRTLTDYQDLFDNHATIFYWDIGAPNDRERLTAPWDSSSYPNVTTETIASGNVTVVVGQNPIVLQIASLDEAAKVLTGDTVIVSQMGRVTDANGTWIVTKIAVDRILLQGSSTTQATGVDTGNWRAIVEVTHPFPIVANFDRGDATWEHDRAGTLTQKAYNVFSEINTGARDRLITRINGAPASLNFQYGGQLNYNSPNTGKIIADIKAHFGL